MMDGLMMLAMGGQPGGAEGGTPWNFPVMMLLIMGIFYFMMIRPQQRKEKERKAMIDNVKSGDRILFSGGMVGTVTNVKDKILVVRIADRVKVEILRGAVNRVLGEDEKIESDEVEDKKA